MSTMPVRRPRVTASSTIPAPVIPPPTTRTSSGSSPLIAAKASVRVWVVNAELATVTPVHRPTADLALFSSLIVPRGALTCNNSARTCATVQRLWAECPGMPCTVATASSRVRSRGRCRSPAAREAVERCACCATVDFSGYRGRFRMPQQRGRVDGRTRVWWAPLGPQPSEDGTAADDRRLCARQRGGHPERVDGGRRREPDDRAPGSRRAGSPGAAAEVSWWRLCPALVGVREQLGLPAECAVRAQGSTRGRGAETDRVRDVDHAGQDRKSTRLNSSHVAISYAVFCLIKKNYIFRQYTICMISERYRGLQKA